MAEKKSQFFEVKDKEYYQRVDPETGELIGDIITTDVVIKEIPRIGFSITYLASIISMIDSIGNKKMQVVKYLLKNMDSNNKLTETVREIAKGAECSIQTVNDTLKLLESCGIIARKTGIVMLSPKLIHKGNAKRERYLMTKFFEVKSASADEKAESAVEKAEIEN